MARKEGHPERKVDLKTLSENAELGAILEQVPQARQLYDIWRNFELSAKTPEDAGRRKSQLFKWDESLTDELRGFFEEPAGTAISPSGRREEMAWGQIIVREAQEDVAMDLHRQKVARLQSQPKGMSKGERLHIRRQKAAIKGTNPKKIR